MLYNLLLILLKFTIQNVSATQGWSNINSDEESSNTRIIRPHNSNIPTIKFEDTSYLLNDQIGLPLNEDDFRRAKIAATVDFVPTTEHDDVFISQRLDPIEIAGLFQGDISLQSMDEYLFLKYGASFMSPRNAITNLTNRWEGGIIPYVISSSYTIRERTMISQAILQFHEHTCVRFKARTNEDDYIHILKGNGCSSSVGRKGGVQTVSLGGGCFILGIFLHELMHTTGFWHEQSRGDRDSFINIIWDNIQSGLEINFEKYDADKIQTLGIEYDLGSIMHYGPYAFANDRSKPTIVPSRRSNIGQRQGFSKKDKQKINTLYDCPDTSSSCTDQDKNCRHWSAFGECEKNPKWMKSNCKKSCSLCGPLPCEDMHIHCSSWSSLGECTRNPVYMLVFCQKSCLKCT